MLDTVALQLELFHSFAADDRIDRDVDRETAHVEMSANTAAAATLRRPRKKLGEPNQCCYCQQFFRPFRSAQGTYCSVFCRGKEVFSRRMAVGAFGEFLHGRALASPMTLKALAADIGLPSGSMFGRLVEGTHPTPATYARLRAYFGEALPAVDVVTPRGSKRGDERPKAPRIVLTCRSCSSASPPLAPAEMRARKSVSPDGSTYLCRRCHGKVTLHGAQMRQLSQTFGISPQDPADQKLMGHRLLLENAIRKAGGRTRVLEAANNARAKGLTEDGKRRLTLGLIASSQRRGEFRLCVRCGLLLYLGPDRIRAGAVGFHGPCYRAWRQGYEWLSWDRTVGPVRDKRRAEMVRKLPPPRPKGNRWRPTNPDVLATAFVAVVRHYGLRESWRDLGERLSLDHSNLRRAAIRFVEQLPASWSLVLKARGAGAHLDELLPVSSLKTRRE